MTPGQRSLAAEVEYLETVFVGVEKMNQMSGMCITTLLSDIQLWS